MLSNTISWMQIDDQIFNHVIKVFRWHKKFVSLKYKYFFIIRNLNYDKCVYITKTKTLSHKFKIK